LALGDRLRRFQKAIGQSRFAMIDMSDDAKIPDIVGVLHKK